MSTVATPLLDRMFYRDEENNLQKWKRQLAALSKRLIAEFGKGYSVSNLEYMRGF